MGGDICEEGRGVRLHRVLTGSVCVCEGGGLLVVQSGIALYKPGVCETAAI